MLKMRLPIIIIIGLSKMITNMQVNPRVRIRVMFMGRAFVLVFLFVFWVRVSIFMLCLFVMQGIMLRNGTTRGTYGLTHGLTITSTMGLLQVPRPNPPMQPTWDGCSGMELAKTCTLGLIRTSSLILLPFLHYEARRVTL